MMVTRQAWWFGLLLGACGGGATPAAEAPSSEATPAPAATTSASASEEKPAAGDGWEGEGEAKGGAPAPEAKPAAAAPDNDATETRTIEVIQKIVKEHRPEVRACYDQARKELPSLQGDLVIHFVLDPAGKVKTIEANLDRSTLKSTAVSDCAIRTIKGLKFPPSSRGMETNVNYPYNFTPSGPPPH